MKTEITTATTTMQYLTTQQSEVKAPVVGDDERNLSIYNLCKALYAFLPTDLKGYFDHKQPTMAYITDVNEKMKKWLSGKTIKNKISIEEKEKRRVDLKSNLSDIIENKASSIEAKYAENLLTLLCLELEDKDKMNIYCFAELLVCTSFFLKGDQNLKPIDNHINACYTRFGDIYREISENFRISKDYLGKNLNILGDYAYRITCSFIELKKLSSYFNDSPVRPIAFYRLCSDARSEGISNINTGENLEMVKFLIGKSKTYDKIRNQIIGISPSDLLSQIDNEHKVQAQSQEKKQIPCMSL